MLEAERLGPLFAGARGVGGRELRRRRTGQGRPERVRRRPPDLGGQPRAAIAQCLDRRREQERLGDRGGLELLCQALLRGLRPEGREIRRRGHAGQDVHPALLELGDLGSEIARARLEQRRLVIAEPAAFDRRPETVLGIAGHDTVGVVDHQAADFFVGAKRVPHVHEHADHVVDAPEEVVGPSEACIRGRAAPEIDDLPGRVGGNARHLVDLALVGHRVHRVAGRGADHQIDLVLEDQLGRDLGGAVRVGLGVPGQDLDRIGPPADLDAAADRSPGIGEHKPVGLTERCQRPGLRADETDLYRSRGVDRRCCETRCRGRSDHPAAVLERAAATDAGCRRPLCVGRHLGPSLFRARFTG